MNKATGARDRLTEDKLGPNAFAREMLDLDDACVDGEFGFQHHLTTSLPHQSHLNTTSPHH